MENLPIGNVTASDYQLHVKKAKSFAGSAAEYCRHNQLDQNKFSYHKSALKQKVKKNMKTGFAKVHLANAEAAAPQMTASKPLLPDPAWLALFVRELGKK